MHHCPHALSQSSSKAVVLTIGVKILGMLQHTNPHRLNWRWYWEILFSLAVEMPNFWKKTKRWSILLPNVWFLWKLQSSLLILGLYHRHWWKFGWYLICRNMSTDFVCFRKSIRAFKKHTSFVWLDSMWQHRLTRPLHVQHTYYCIIYKQNMWCDQAKSVGSRKYWF